MTTTLKRAADMARTALEMSGLVPPREKPPTRTQLIKRRAQLLKERGGAVERALELKTLRAQRTDAMLAAAKPFEARIREILQSSVSDFSTQAQLSRVERELRESCDPLLRLNGPIHRWLDELHEHFTLDTGGGVTLNLDVEIRDCERIGYQPGSEMDRRVRRMKAEWKLRQEALALIEYVREARERLFAMQLEEDPDILGAVRDVAAGLPKVCPCGLVLPKPEVVT